MTNSKRLYRFLLISIIGVFWVGCVFPQSRYANEMLSATAQVGKELFNSKGACFACHGEDADRQTVSNALNAKLNPQPTNLRNYNELQFKSDEEMRRVITDGIPDTSMVPMGLPEGKLNPQEIDFLIVYLKEIRR